MIINIFGPSGSGKTTFVSSLLKSQKTQDFYEKFIGRKSGINLNKKISISLIPLPKFRGTIQEFFNIFCIDVKYLLNLNEYLNILSKSIFDMQPCEENLIQISERNLETFSAGQIRRLFVLKSLLIDSNIIIIDEPFSNSDEKIWENIYRSIDTKPRSIILSHVSLEGLFFTNKTNISIHINEIINTFKILQS